MPLKTYKIWALEAFHNGKSCGIAIYDGEHPAEESFNAMQHYRRLGYQTHRWNACEPLPRDMALLAESRLWEEME